MWSRAHTLELDGCVSNPDSTIFYCEELIKIIFYNLVFSTIKQDDDDIYFFSCMWIKKII